VNYDHSVFVEDMIIIECFNFMGEPEKLVLLRDTLINKHIPYNPLAYKGNTDCWFSSNGDHFFAVCAD
jgi:hypothetical protein